MFPSSFVFSKVNVWLIELQILASNSVWSLWCENKTVSEFILCSTFIFFWLKSLIMSICSDKLNTSNSSSGGYNIDELTILWILNSCLYRQKYEDKVVSRMDHKGAVNCQYSLRRNLSRVLWQGSLGSLVSLKKFWYCADEQTSRCIRSGKSTWGIAWEWVVSKFQDA